MFWVFKGPKIAANFFNNILNNNFSNKNDNYRQRGKGYDRLVPLEDEINGNYGPALSVITSGINEEKTDTRVQSYVTTLLDKVTTHTSGMSSPTDTDVSFSQSFCSVGQSYMTPNSDIEMASFDSVDSTSLYQITDDESENSEDEDEDLTCNVCDRSYVTIRQLLSHQMRRRHYGCSTCEDIFPTWMALEAHKEVSGHLSDDDLYYDDSEDDDEFFEEEEEERERLL